MTVHEPFSQSLVLPRGLVTVDLINERGKVVQREQAENFISLQSQEVARWWQRMMWGIYNPNEINDALGNKPSDMPWFSAQHIAAWIDSTAEDPATENAVRGDIVAWASRHPVGSPSGKRGVVDIAASEFKDAYAKWVFNWTSAQGNGTFQSVGWTRIDETTGYPIPGGVSAGTLSVTNLSNGAPNNSNSAPLWWDAANSLWNTWEHVSASSQLRLVSVPATGGATTQICLLPASAWTNPYAFGLARIGTDFIVSGGNTGTIMSLRRYSAAGAQIWTTSPSVSGGVGFWDCTVDGSGNIWTICGDNKIRSHNPADGAITGTVTLPTIIGFSPITTYPYGIAYDPADGNFWVAATNSFVTRMLYKVTSAGTMVSGVLPVSFLGSSYTVTSTAPYVGLYYVPYSAMRDSYHLTSWYNSGQIGSNISRASAQYATIPWGLTMKGTALWGGTNRGTVISGASAILPLSGPGPGAGVPGTLGSRSRLSAPVTKTASQSMKITYQFDFS